jgi:hypothetical protein
MKRICTFSLLTILLCVSRVVWAQPAEPQTTPAEEPTPAMPFSVTGSGTTNYLPLWTASTTLGNSKLYQTGGQVGIGATKPASALDVAGRINSSVGYRIAGGPQLYMPGGSAAGNTAIGNSLNSITTGLFNTAIDGCCGLSSDTTHSYNTTAGNTVVDNLPGSFITAIGNAAFNEGTGDYNTGIGGGVALLGIPTGKSNTAIGYGAIVSLNTGLQNNTLGEESLYNITSGSYNIAIGYNAGELFTTENNNIDVANNGTTGDSGVVRFGTSGTQTSFFVAGVNGVNVGANTSSLLIDSSGQLGTISSSRRFKTDIQDMGDASRDLMRLRPVTFIYQKPFADGSQPVQYGLIAEEVADVYPDLVAYSADGQIQTVKYQMLAPLLLNEVQRDQTEIRELDEQMTKLEAALAAASAGQ